ncbi:hypothetical protein ACFO5R_06515 [Halosolutus amylolyticus]|uniref:DUF7124 domain-containing protein n=1 Tax=Halosolutus amylolyticus TaxID=2932267 RepID=A0ABD5PNG2_9EURY|nr:hypothetical protein [Halosolutus amylolyticus]
MTDRIDLDDLEPEPEADDPDGNDGDWVWRDDGDPDAEPDAPPSEPSSADRDRGGARASANGAEANATDADPSDAPAPHVPKTGDRTPAGIPAAGRSGDASRSAGAEAGGTGPSAPRPMGADAATGPHGGGADDMTMAITYDAVRDLERPARVFAGATWADWIGIVGDVPAHVIQKFQRDHGIDADFFNGTGTAPAERLAEIDRNSMFYADRLVLVGRAGADESIAEDAGWEFVPLSEAAAKADWDLASDDDAA